MRKFILLFLVLSLFGLSVEAKVKKASFAGSVDEVFTAAVNAAKKNFALQTVDRETYSLVFRGGGIAGRDMLCMVRLRLNVRGTKR